jgi:hypothetical protein
MLFNLPTTKAEVAGTSCDELTNSYIRLAKSEKRKWLKAASGKNGSIRLSAPPKDASTIQINFWDPKSGAYAGCSWIDKDPFD